MEEAGGGGKLIEVDGMKVGLRKEDGMKVGLRKDDGMKVGLRKDDGMKVGLRKDDALFRSKWIVGVDLIASMLR